MNKAFNVPICPGVGWIVGYSPGRRAKNIYSSGSDKLNDVPLYMSTSCQLGSRVIPGYSDVKSLFYFLIWRLQPQNLKIKKAFQHQKTLTSTLGVSGLFCRLILVLWKILLMNNVDHDKTPHDVTSDLGLLGLPMTLLRAFKKEILEKRSSFVHTNENLKISDDF